MNILPNTSNLINYDKRRKIDLEKINNKSIELSNILWRENQQFLWLTEIHK